MTHAQYITTSIPYVNAVPHVGFALELVQADALARFHRLLGRAVRFQTGTDENAVKNALAAAQQGLATQEIVDRNASRFRDLLPALDVAADDFLRTTEARHRRGVHAFWSRLRPADVYRKPYRGLYCTGCEDFVLEKDLVAGRCPDHDALPVAVAEENWFFRLSAYQEEIRRRIEDGTIEVVPPARRNEVLGLLRRGLQDISISRCAQRASGWGIAVPDDPTQVIYVWIDALINYISGPGFGEGEAWQQWWSPQVDKTHVIGKNVWKFHAIYWPALLLSADLPLPNRIVVHGFVTAGGRKISKTLGNAVDPFDCVRVFGSDAVRYYLLRAIPPFEDGDFSWQRLAGLYHADLANGLGNLVSRLTTLCRRAGLAADAPPAAPPSAPDGLPEALERCEFDRALAILWDIVSDLDRQIEAVRPWELLKDPANTDVHSHLRHWRAELCRLAHWLTPLLPRAAEKITQVLSQPPAAAVVPLFPRIAR